MKKLEREDNAIRGTNDEASFVKAFAVSKGYYKDDFVHSFVHDASSLPPPPLMNRGYYARAIAIETIARRFLSEVDGLENHRQIVNLGCGFDTVYFRLCANYPKELEHLKSFRFFDVDFEQVISRKKHIISDERAFKPFLENYCIFSCDLRNSNELKVLLEKNGFKNVPTLFISECVLIYIDPAEGSSVITMAAQICDASMFVTYEQIKPNDAFGKVMIRNLQARNIPLHSLMKFPDLNTQMNRYLECGYSVSHGRTMLDVYNNFLKDKQHIEKLEKFDEWEEWELILSHYCLVVSSKNTKLFDKLKF